MSLTCTYYRVDPSSLNSKSVFEEAEKQLRTYPDAYDYSPRTSNARYMKGLKPRIVEILADEPLTMGAIKQATNTSYPQLAIACKELVAEGVIKSFVTNDKIPLFKYKLTKDTEH